MIGVFDSGFGGLTILKSFLKYLPNYGYLYLGDNARAPYGSRPQELIYQFTTEAVDFLFSKGCDLIIIACFTASAEALCRIQQEYLVNSKNKSKKVLGVIKPLVEEAAKESRLGRIGIIGTKGTIESQAFIKELNKLNPNLKIYQQSCPLLVPLIEEGYQKRRETKMILRGYLRPLKLKKVDTLILGCTHYPIMSEQIGRVMGKSCQVLDSGKIIAESLVNYLERHREIESLLSKNDKINFYTTDNPEKFKKLGSKFLGRKISEVEKIKLE